MDFYLDPSVLMILIVFGFVAAFIDSVVGGGGLIALPALLFTGLNPASAVATNKLASTMGSATSNIVFYRSGNLDLKSAFKLVPLTFIGSIIGAWTVHLMNPEVLKPLMLIMLGAVAIYTIFKRIGVVFPLIRNCLVDTSLFLLSLFCYWFYDGFLGPGTGSFLMFSLLFIGYDFLKAAGNAKLLNLGSNVGALLMFMYVGQVNYAYGFIMGIAQIAGGIVGSKFAIKKEAGMFVPFSLQ